MELIRKKRGIWTRAFGLAGVTAAACAACCASLPLLGTVLAWLGIAGGLGAVAAGWYVVAAGMLSAMGIGLFFIARRRRAQPPARNSPTCACGTSCKT
jgi:hypothetical protein